MAYELRTTDGKYTRRLDTGEFKAILRLALQHGWRPSPKHIQGGSLRLNERFSLEEGKALAAALERSLQYHQASLPPIIMIAIFESIAVLRRSESQFVQA